MKTLIDGDGIAYRSAAAVEKTRYLVQIPHGNQDLTDAFNPANSWKEAREEASCDSESLIWSRKEVGSLEDAKTICDGFMRRIRENTTDDYRLFLTPSSGNFRDSLSTHTKYKANRDGSLRPVYLADLREYLCNSYSGIVVQGHEAEDQISIEACRTEKNYIVVGHDKDLLQIPGKHYDWVRNEHFVISFLEAVDALWIQVLMGDRTDNIPGCWGMGFQKAKNRIIKWKADTDFLFEVVLAEYEKSKRVKGCPYADESEEETQRRVYETYWLVKLKEYQDEAPWYPKIKKTKNIEESASPLPLDGRSEADGTTKAKPDTNTSDCAPVATEREGGTTTPTTTSATCATV